jgi:hypothetical protein
VVKRLRNTLAIIGAVFVATAVAYKVSVPESPDIVYTADYLRELPANQWKAKEVRLSYVIL